LKDINKILFSDKKLIMKYIIEIPESKMAFAEEFFNSVSFIKKVTPVASNEITNVSVLKSIEDYENKKLNPTPLNLEDLKVMLGA
jgi:hypothetical protein